MAEPPRKSLKTSDATEVDLQSCNNGRTESQMHVEPAVPLPVHPQLTLAQEDAIWTEHEKLVYESITLKENITKKELAVQKMADSVNVNRMTVESLNKLLLIDRSQWPENFKTRFATYDSMLKYSERIDNHKLYDKALESKKSLLNEKAALQQKLDPIMERISDLEREHPWILDKSRLGDVLVEKAPAKYSQAASAYPTSTRKFEAENEGRTFCYEKESPQSLTLMLPEIFGVLKEELNFIPYNREVHELVFKMHERYDKSFDNEAHMKADFKDLLHRWFGDGFYQEDNSLIPAILGNEASQVKADAVVLCDNSIIALMDYKNYMLSAYSEVIVNMNNYLSIRFKEAAKNPNKYPIHRYMPCLNITLTGPFLTLYGMMMEWTKDGTVKIHAEHFATVPFRLVTIDQDRIQKLMCFYGAVRNALNRLRLFYSDPDTLISDVTHFPVAFHPFVNSVYLDGDEQRSITFDYVSRLEFENVSNTNRYIYQVRCHDPVWATKRCMAKFFLTRADADSVSVHRYCAAAGYAPALMGWKKLRAGWWLMVMEDLTNDYEILGPDVYAVDSVVRAAVLSAREYLNKEQRDDQGQAFRYVHGDLRFGNVMQHCRMKTDIKIIDFDWAGVVGKVRFPISMWRDAVGNGGSPQELITVAHDEAIFR